MCLVASRSGGGYSDYIEGEIRRIDLQSGVVIKTTASLGTGCWPRFSPDGTQFAYMDGNTVKICTIDGGAVGQFASENKGNISWTNSGIWVSGNSRITKYDLNGSVLTRYTSGVVNRNYVSHNEVTGSGVAESDWHPVIYNMKRGTVVLPRMPPGAWAVGCSACPSPDGTKITNNLVDNTIDPQNPSSIHRSMRILDTLGNMLLYLRLENITKFNEGYRWDTQCWSSNSNDWIVIPVGQGGSVADQNISACIYNITTKEKYCLKDNSNTNSYWQPFDYYSGKLPGTSPMLQLSPASLSFAADSGAANPPSQTVTISTAAGSLTGVLIGGQKSWLTATPSATSGNNIAIVNAVRITGLRVGIYRDTITVGSANGGSKNFVVTLTVRNGSVQPVLTSVEISPPVFTVATGGTVTFLATPKNQTAAIMKGVSIVWSASGGGTISQTGIFTAGAAIGGAHAIVAAASAGGVTLRDTAFLDISNTTAAYKRVDCGDNTLAVAGWERDDPYVNGGRDWTFPGAISTAGIQGGAPADIYKSVRRGSPHVYTFTGLPNGIYTVRLHFADGVDSVRSMGYSIQNVNVLNGFSIAGAAGGANVALAMDFSADLRLTDTITINATGTGVSDVMEAGIEIMENRATAITLISPVGGETYSVGDVVPIRWHADLNKLSQVYIEYSPNNGRSWVLITQNQGIMSSDSTQWGHFMWTIPAVITEGASTITTATQTGRIRVRPYFANPGVLPAVTIGAISIRGSNAVSLPGAQSSLSAPDFFVYARTNGLEISVNSFESFELSVYTVHGALAYFAGGKGRTIFTMPRHSAGCGFYVVRMKMADRMYCRTILFSLPSHIDTVVASPYRI